MVCISPILLTKLPKNKFPEGLLVSCGSCINCRKQRAREWAIRLEHEKQYADKAYFLTLTYSNEMVPKCYSVIKKELQLFWKLLRKRTNKSIKYYACGEYGGKFGRPHYHAIMYVYGDKHKDNTWKRYLNYIWKKGFVHVGTVTDKSINYVVEYVDKKIMQYNGIQLGCRRPPFRVMSNGIGQRYLIEHAQVLYNNKCLIVKDKSIGLPRYYKKKLKIDPREMMKVSKSVELQALKKYMKKHRLKKMNKNEWYAYYELVKKQKGINMEARGKIYKRERLF